MIIAPKQFDGFNVTFNTGEYCNLACKYCYEVNTTPSRLPLEYAQRFIDLLLEDDDPAGLKGTKDEWIGQQGLIMDFIGGDALMFPDLVEDILLYFMKKSRKLNHRWADRWRASISTNGTLFEVPRVRRFVEKWNPVLSLGVSIDGTPEIHDKNRVYHDGRGSMSTIIKWWDWYRKLYPEADTKSTLTRESIPYIYDSLRYMHEDLYLMYINQNFAFEDQSLTPSDLETLDKQLSLCVDYVLEHRDDLYWSMIDRNLETSKSFKEHCEIDPGKSWCGSGAMPALGTNGKIYPCFRFLPHTQATNVDMSVGDIWSGFTKKKNFQTIRSLTREVISPPQCRECQIESQCSWCIAGSYSEKGEPYRQTYICETQMLRDKWAKEYWRRYSDLQRV